MILEGQHPKKTGAPRTTTALSSNERSVPKPPSVFDYRNYREYLADWLQFKKTTHTSFSGKLFAKRARLASHTLLGMVIRGERNLSHKSLRAFLRALELNTGEAHYFENLVLFNQSKDPSDQSYYLGQMVAHAPAGAQRESLKVLTDYSDFLSQWYHVVVRELVSLNDFRPDPVWMSRRLQRRITPQEAEQAWARLLRLGMIEETSPGHFEVTDYKIAIEPHLAQSSVREFHHRFLKHASDCVLSQPFEERQLGFITFTLQKSEIEKLKKELDQFRSELFSRYPKENTTRDELVTVSIQLIQMTESIEGEHKND